MHFVCIFDGPSDLVPYVPHAVAESGDAYIRDSFTRAQRASSNVQVMAETARWDRSDRMTERDGMERTDELYLRSQLLESKLKRLQVTG